MFIVFVLLYWVKWVRNIDSDWICGRFLIILMDVLVDIDMFVVMWIIFR